MLDLRLLNAFVILYEERSVSSAARRLNVTQPAMSAKLRRLREFFDDPLFVRAAKGLVPTERAERLLAQTGEILSLVQTLERDAAPFDPAKDPLHLRIAASEFVHSVFLPSLMQGLLTRVPGATLTMQPLSLTGVDKEFENHALDFAILPNFLASLNMQTRKLFDETFVYLMRQDHPMSRKKLTFEALSQCQHIRVAPSLTSRSNRIGKIFKDAKQTREVRITVNNYAAAVELVAKTDLITLFPKRMVGQLREAFVTYDPPFELEPIAMCLVWHPRKQNTKSHAWAREFIAKVAKNLEN